MKTFRTVSAVMLLLTVVLTVSGCAGKNFEPLELVPAGSDFIAGLKVSEGFRNWEIYNELEGDSEITDTITEGKDEFFEATGIDINDVSEVVLFGRTADMEHEMDMMQPAGETDLKDMVHLGYAGAIFTGNFVDYDVVANISERTGTVFTEEEIGDFTLYLGDDGESAVLPVNNTMFLLGTPAALKDCVLVATDEKEPLSGPVVEAYTGLDDVMVRMAMTVPEDAKETFSDMEESEESMPVGFRSFADMQTIGLAAELGTMGLSITASMGFPDAQTAADAADALTTTIDFLMMMGADEAAAERVERLEINASANAVFLDYTFTFAELDEMMETMQDYESSDEFPMIPPMFKDMPVITDELPEGFDITVESAMPDDDDETP